MKELVVLMLVLVKSTDAEVQATRTDASCVPAQPVISTNQVRKQCFPYFAGSKGHCKNYLKANVSLFADNVTQSRKEMIIKTFEIDRKMLEVLNIFVSEACLRVLYTTTCLWYFPICDLTTDHVMGKDPCRECCDYFVKVCAKELEIAKAFDEEKAGFGYPVSGGIVNCSHFKYRNGGDIPECYYLKELNTETDKLQDEECYYGNGLGYNGTANVTRSGEACQAWSLQCPHRHDHPLDEYPELVNASNWCRNPGGQAPNGPWCYTSRISKRWEYCGVKKCPDPAPTKAPDVVQAFSTGPSKIFIQWRAIPLAFVHGTPLGFRIRVSKVSGNYEVLKTANIDKKYFEIESLEPLTNYSVSILEFNKNSDGLRSPPVYVTTMPRHFAAIKFTMNIKNTVYTIALSDRNSTQFKMMGKEVKSKLTGIFQNLQSEKYRVYQIRIISFYNGSVGVEFDITAELIDTTSWSAAQSITGKILNHSKLKGSQFTSLLVKASPPPPVNLSNSIVSSSSAKVKWSAPAHSEPFSITNYTVQYKKAGTKMPYYNAVTIGADTRNVTLENLDSSTEYLVRVASVNNEGSEPSKVMVLRTKALEESPNVAIIASVVILAVILVAGGLFSWRWLYKKRQEEKELRAKIQRLKKDPYKSEVDWFDLLKINVVKRWWEIPRHDLTIEGELGSGAFGVVRKGFLKKQDHNMYCAVKMLKENPSERELRDLCNEINLMSQIGDHPNVVSLIGACTVNGPLFLVVKFAPNGCLLSYLRENRQSPGYENQKISCSRKMITEKERLKFAHDIANGMAYLENHKYVHRDLAARNVLLGKNMVAMVSDFGLTRDIYEFGIYDNTAGGYLPVRWMAIESLQDYTYTTKTDVWSYGVLVWEIENGGIVPYGGMISGKEVLQQLKEGYRLENNPGTSYELYNIMCSCWNSDPNQRPTFSDLANKTSGLLTTAVNEA